MTQITVFLKRLKNPTVVLSIISQIVILLSALNVEVDTETVNVIVTGVLSILVTLGIMSNPDTVKKTYTDDIQYCKTCNKKTVHSKVAGKMICIDCQTEE